MIVDLHAPDIERALELERLRRCPPKPPWPALYLAIAILLVLFVCSIWALF